MNPISGGHAAQRIIVGILAAIVLAVGFAFWLIAERNERRLERDTIRILDTKLIAVALLRYAAKHKGYPQGIDGGEIDVYLQGGTPHDPLGGMYPYEQVSGGMSYYLGANLETKGHEALQGDADSAGTDVEGNDADGCGNEANRYCYDVKP